VRSGADPRGAARPNRVGPRGRACRPRVGALLAAALWWALCAGPSARAAPGDLDQPDRERVEAALERLAAGPAEALEAALAGFESAPLAGRAARAELLVRAGRPEHISLALTWLSEPGLEVRTRLVEFLGRADLLDAEAAARSAGLAALARAAGPHDLRSAALRALGRLDAASSADELEALAPRLPAELAREAVVALGELDAGQLAIRRLVEAAAAGRSALPEPAWTAALEPYGKRLPRLPEGGLAPAERAPLVLFSRHPSQAVREAAAKALDAAFDRLLWLGERERLFALLEGLAGDGFDAAALTYRLACLCLSSSGDLAGARRAAAALLEAAPGRSPVEARAWRFAGHYLLASADLCAGEVQAAREAYGRAAEVLQAELAERPELRRRQGAPAPAEAERAVEAQARLALCRLMSAGALLHGGAEPEAAELEGELEAALLAALEAQLVDVRHDGQTNAAGLDLLLDGELSPRRLLCFAEVPGDWPREQRLEWLERLLSALAKLSPGELPGLDPNPPPPQDLPEDSPARGAARQERLRALRLAELDRIARRLSDPDQRRNRLLWRQVEQDLFAALERDQQRGYVAPLELRTPSLAALDLAVDHRATGRADRAVAVLERMRAELARATGSASAGAFFEEWIGARIGWALGSSLSDRGLGDDLARASAELDGASQRLETMQRELQQRLDELGQGRLGALVLEEVDPAERERLLAQQRLVRRFQSDVKVAQAVHTNVRLQDPERARQLFEAALELEQNDFMRALLACYRARAGRRAEARFLLARLEPAPDLFYNLACAHALLGDLELALEYLARELDPSRMGALALERQKAWARGDPDLASLRGDARFSALTEPAQPGESVR
jgi:hypothetical protein